VYLIRKNLKLEITVVTNFETYKELKPLGLINYKFIEPELGNTKIGKEWNNVDRHLAYELSPYDTTLVMDIDYFCYTDNLLQFMNTKYDFLIPTEAHDLTQRNTFHQRVWSMIPMVWATIFVFKKTEKVQKLFNTIKYVKKYYHYFNEMYRIFAKNFRNDYVFAIALQQLNGFVNYNTLPIRLATLPSDCKVVKMTDAVIAWEYNDQINFVVDQDVHILNKEVANV
jgi:hypothetical protein